MLHGHHAVLEALEDAEVLPPVLLFLGPRSVGKWAMAEYLRERWGVGASDLVRVHRLTVPSARDIVDFAGVAPSGASARLAIVDLVGATPAALNVLLKVMEDARPEMRFILIAEQAPSATISSRAITYAFSVLSVAEVEAVLLERRYSPAEARRLAELSGGSVERALKDSAYYELKAPVLRVLRAFREHDPSSLDAVAGIWTDAHTDLLGQWCLESVTKNWKIFSEAESEIPGSSLQLRILMALRADIRPRLVVRSSLMNILRGS